MLGQQQDLWGKREQMNTCDMAFGLTSRQTELFPQPLLMLLKLDNEAPDHTTLSQPFAKLGQAALNTSQRSRPVPVLIDIGRLSVHVGHFYELPKKQEISHFC